MLSTAGKKASSRRARSGRSRVVIDWDAANLRVVEAEVAGGHVAAATLHTVAIPADVDALDAPAFGRFIARMLKEWGVGARRGLMTVPREVTVVKTLSAPAKVDTAQLAGIVQYQVTRDLTFDHGQAVVDFAVQGRADDAPGTTKEPAAGDARVSVLAVAVQQKHIDFYRHLATAARFRLDALAWRPDARLHFLRQDPDADPGHAVCVLHLTAGHAELDIVAGGALAMSQGIAFLAQPPEGEAGKGTAEKQVSDAGIDRLVAAALHRLRGYALSDAGHEVSCIRVCGDVGCEQVLADRLAEQLGVPAKVFEMGATVKAGGDVTPGGHVAALGAALVGHADPLRSIDLLHPKRPAADRDTRKFQLAAVVVLLLVLLVSPVLIATVSLARKHRDVEDLQRQADALTQENESAKTLARRAELAEQWMEGRHSWLSHLATLSELFPPSGEVHVTDMTAGSDGMIHLDIQAKTTDVITALITKLNEAGYGVKAGRVSSRSDRAGYNFRTTLVLMIDQAERSGGRASSEGLDHSSGGGAVA